MLINDLYKSPYRKKKKTEENAKVVASVWGAEFIQFLAALYNCFALDDLNNGMNCTRMI